MPGIVQGIAFALLVTRIPAIQDRYGVSDALLPVFLAAVPVLAGTGSVATERLVKRVPQGEYLSLPGGHMFPLERPQETADLLKSVIGRWDGRQEPRP